MTISYIKYCVVLLIFLQCSSAEKDSLHRTKYADRISDLYCYICDSMTHKDKCLDVKQHNNTSIYTKCDNDQRICKVAKISMSTSTENTTGDQILWLLQRNCTKVCEPVCVTIGERTKLRSCTTCCESSFCNSGNGAETLKNTTSYSLLTIPLLSYIRILFAK